MLFNLNLTPFSFITYAGLSFLFFIFGIFGLAHRVDNLLMVLLFGELVFVGLFFSFIVVSKGLGSFVCQVYGLFILNAAAVESAVGLVLILNSYRTCGFVEVA